MIVTFNKIKLGLFQAKPSQAKPSQAKPSQAKPSQANILNNKNNIILIICLTLSLLVGYLYCNFLWRG
ncbi:hypothetical protein OFS03_01300 [Brachyspira hyodysenteriae]|nr:hypothetical protein [Brachyspira hyodysenteriae]MDA0061867.1 hypothetical protein [Brachyspira hyodysenteriae]MDA0088597.1 hypothetical protein [Brachyspira hyodysenteriae]